MASVVPADFLPIREAAKAYGTSQDTLYRLLAVGRLTRYRREMDKKTWLKRSELDALFTPKAEDRSHRSLPQGVQLNENPLSM